jgi:hypothetical protein
MLGLIHLLLVGFFAVFSYLVVEQVLAEELASLVDYDRVQTVVDKIENLVPDLLDLATHEFLVG